MKNKELKGYMSYANGEIELSKWIINKDTLGYSGWRGSQDLRELASGDNPTLGALIWRKKLTDFALLLLTSSKTMLFELGARD